MNLNKCEEYFSPMMLNGAPIHIIGCGAIGSTVAELLARLGITDFVLWDFDEVAPHNIANQMFFESQIGSPKTKAVQSNLQAINGNVNVTLKNIPYKDQNLTGYVFLCVDSIDIRRQIVETNKNNPNIKAVFDFRMRLVDAQHYAAPWDSEKEKKILLDSMQFSHNEALAETPVSACGVTLSVAPTVRMICSLGVANFMNYIRTGTIKRLILIDAFEFILDAFQSK